MSEPAEDSIRAERDRLRYQVGVADYPGKSELVARLEQLTKERDAAYDLHDCVIAERDESRAEVERLTKENESLRMTQGGMEFTARISELETALGFYAASESWKKKPDAYDGPGVGELPSDADTDGGTIARTAVAERSGE